MALDDREVSFLGSPVPLASASGVVGVQTMRLPVLDAYMLHCERRGFSDETRKHYRKIVTAWLTWLETIHIDLDSAGPAEVQGFLDSRPHLRTPSARATYLSWLRSFCRWAYSEGITSADPTMKIEAPMIPRAIAHPISEADLNLALRESPNPRMTAWLMLGAKAGFRCKEMAGLQVEDLNRESTPLHLKVSNPKGHSERIVPAHADVVAALEAYGMPAYGSVFVGGFGARFISPGYVSSQISGYFRSLGIHAVAHSLRHRFGSRMYALTKDLRLVQELLGHASPATTQIYTYSNVDEAVAVFGNL